MYHSHTKSPAYPSQTDVNFAQDWPGAGLADRVPRRSRRPRPEGVPDHRPGRRRGRAGGGVTMAEPLACPRCAIRYPLEERFCARVRHAAHLRRRGRRRARDEREAGARPQDQAAVRARATCGAWPRAASSPRPSSSRCCCSRKACRARCGARPGSTCPTCWRPARVTCWCPSRGSRPPATCCSRATSRSIRPHTLAARGRRSRAGDAARGPAARGRRRGAGDLARRRLIALTGPATRATPGARAPAPAERRPLCTRSRVAVPMTSSRPSAGRSPCTASTVRCRACSRRSSAGSAAPGTARARPGRRRLPAGRAPGSGSGPSRLMSAPPSVR